MISYIPICITDTKIASLFLCTQIPQSLTKKDGYDHRDALFGMPPYGGSIQEKLYYTTDNLCSNSNSGAVLTGYPVERDGEGNALPFASPFILMIDRGDCSFVQKVRNAQHAGAAAVLIADSTCICGMSDCVMSEGQVFCEEQEPIMDDDGTGGDITIPSFLVFKQDADKIKAEIKDKNQPVRAEMTFRLPTPDATVEYELWTTASNVLSDRFLQTFGSAALALAGEAKFTPQIYIYDGTRAGCRGLNGMNQCVGLCTNSGRYCATDPDNDLLAGLTGADVVTESLRRICIWNMYGVADSVGEPWWVYVKNFIVQCNDPEQPMKYKDMDCITNVMTMANIDPSQINDCMEASGGLTADAPNTELEKMITSKEISGAIIIPSVFVNQVPIRGELSYRNVFRAICAGYATGSEPKICQSCMYCTDERSCVESHGKCKAGYGSDALSSLALANGNGISLVAFLISISIIVLCFTVMGYCLYQRQQRRMRNEIRGILAEYMPVGSYVLIQLCICVVSVRPYLYIYISMNHLYHVGFWLTLFSLASPTKHTYIYG